MMNDTQARCRDAADRCAAACIQCASACIAEHHVAAMEKCIRLDADCAAICRLLSDALARDSEFAIDYAELCARLCVLCADECSRHAAAHCKACSDACRACADACRAMI